MDDNFWESLRQDFMRLRAECPIAFPHNPVGRLTAIETPSRTTERWRFKYHNGKDGSGVAKRFSWTAESAAARMGFVGPVGEGVFYWLDQLKSNAPNSHIETLTTPGGIGKPNEIYLVEILDVCGLSADYCRKCQADEIRSLRTSGNKPAGALGFRGPAQSEAAAQVVSDLPERRPEANERIERALEDAPAQLEGPPARSQPEATTGVTSNRSQLPTEYRRASDEAKPSSSSGADGQGTSDEKLDDSHLPDLAPDAAERIADVLKDARSYLSGNANETHLTQAMALYLDSLAWEYVLTQSSTAFGALANGISAKAREEFAGDLAVAEDRKQYWIRESRERALNGIFGSVIPISVASHQVEIFRDLQQQFLNLPGERGELQVIFFDGARFNIQSACSDSIDDELHRTNFEQLARQAMAALDFKFADSSRAIFYWLELLKQSPLFKQWKIRKLCLASATFCGELKTRAVSASIGREGYIAQVSAQPQVISPGFIPSGQTFGTPPLQNAFPNAAMSRRSVGNPIMHVDLYFPLRRHSIVPGAEGPAQPLCDRMRDEIIRIADRIQAVENPEFPPAEAADRWLDRLSPESPSVWELGEVLDASVLYCQTFATYLIRVGNPGLAKQFDGFANQFDALRKELLTTAESQQINDSAERRAVVVGGIEGRDAVESAASDTLRVLTGKDAPVRSWEEVEIRFLSDERVQIKVGRHTESRNYAEFGFEDGRSKTPNRAWSTLRFLAESDGIILQAPHGHDWTGIEKRIQEIRKRFRAHFRLDEDPILFAGGYRAQFKISCAPSYKS